nr:PREDICTED: protein FAM47E-like [Latimeria chalumnae]|eukprot:XP_006014188.1 PREDICTED: protein FAM47E-like [Latimeria chalumnae]
MTIRPTPVYGGSSSRLSRSRSAQSKASSYHPSWVKIKYGAWYLDPSKWKKRRADEPLQDPDAKEDDMELELRTKLIEQDAELRQLHGIHAFKEFIERKGCRRPEVRETFVFKHGGVAFY